ncbi:uncharacterized protein DUF1540 [Orenia metallireducens]|uniref:DUF1540 domain-containing protein n=1 Tax=Orenia metallireducens TaxID=1413210 RepID=A0A285HCS0_9FIRM|nr:DUF1540 domain-containing protein [Orenia metallireducens]PRX27705.1 uncharacterized protein DUF1540 [Orenia metallireducens]SNY33525.1 protein of unknown function [Orenia metallireducens]
MSIISQKSHVHCTVNNCQWWEGPNLCIAEKILVVSDEFAKKLPNEMDVENTNQIVDDLGSSPVDECYQSCCKTFVPRDKYQAEMGGSEYNNVEV